ncbi:MAG: RNA polymerase sigma factor [Anaerovoracaceae bacterium]|jgi:RNA polymerase sigma factor (sigma-70 family)
MTQSITENLILQLSKKEPKALERLYDETKVAVYGLALSILKKPQDAEDVMQETYIRIYKGASGYVPKGKPMAWILRIARNLSLDRIKSESKGEFSLEEGWFSEAGSDFAGSSIDKLLLEAVLSHLTEEERQIVIMHALAGLKHREIAQILEIPLATTLSKYRRSLSKLRKMLEEKKVERV